MKYYVYFIRAISAMTALLCVQTSRPFTVTGDDLMIGASQTLATGVFNSVLGQANTNRGYNSTIAGGLYNLISTNAGTTVPQAAVISGGDGNTVEGWAGAIGGGHNNIIEPTRTNTLGRNLGVIDSNNIAIPSEQIVSEWSVIGGGAGNQIHTARSVIAGGVNNMIQPYAMHSAISGGVDNRIGYASGYSAISGGGDNIITQGAWWSAINGGQANEIRGPIPDEYTAVTNCTSGACSPWGPGGATYCVNNGTCYDLNFYAWIGGGFENMIFGLGYEASIGGGYGNTNNAVCGTIGGGDENIVADNAYYSTIAGGGHNQIRANSQFGSVGGGWSNVVSAAYAATVTGGRDNEASGWYSQAGGCMARATNLASFVWSDNSSWTPFYSSANNEFAVRSFGGVRFITGTSSGTNVGAALLPGSGSWSNLSDRNVKENFRKVDARAVLQKVAAMPVTTWNYKAQGSEIRHIGPTAQDFRAALAVGENETSISSVDADGVALAAIQGLNSVLEEKEKQIDDQANQIRTLEARLERIEKALRRD